MRLGSKQLRRRFAILGWDDLDAVIGDAFFEFAAKVTYREKTHDSNRSRWPVHEIWLAVQSTVAESLADKRAGVCGNDVREVNRAEHNRMLAGMQLGLATSQAAADGVEAEDFEPYLKRNANTLSLASQVHPVPIGDRIAKATAKVRFKEG